MAEKNKKILTAIVILLIVLPFVLADLSSTNYNMSGAVVSSGGSKSTSTNFISRLALGILSGISTSVGFENFLGIFYGSDTTPTTVEIKYPVSSTLYYSYLGTLNYTVDPTAVSCWYSKNGGLTNSTPVTAETNFTNIFSGTVKGTNTWTVYCNDSVNNVGYDSVTFSIDQEIPNIYFSGQTPTTNTVLSKSYFVVNATSSDESDEHSTFLDFNNSLVGWWKLEETTDGVTFIDSSKYANNGTCSGTSCPVVTGGKRGLAYEFDGNDQIDVGNSSIFNLTEEITIASWVKINDIKPAYAHIISKGQTGGTIYMQYIMYVSNGYPRFLIANGTVSSSASGSLMSVGQWYHVVGTINSTSLKFYMNGQLISTTTRTINPQANTKKVFLGSNGVGGETLNGSIDDVMIFNRALSESEVKSIYNAQSNQYGNNFQNIGNGFYNYTIYSQDLAGNVNSTSRNLTINMAPNGLNVTVVNDKPLNSKNGSLNLSWVDSSDGESGFSIERSTDNSTFSEINTTNANVVKYTNDNLNDNKLYFFRVRSFIGDTYSTYSNVGYNITADRTQPFTSNLTLVENKSANAINVKQDDQDNGLVLYMPFEEGTGTTTSDWSGNEHHGVMNGNPNWTSGKEGNGGALSFDGVNDYVNITLSTALSVYTLSGWFYRTDVSGSWGTILGSRPSSSGFEFESIWSGASRLVMYSGGASAYYTLNNWHYFSLVQNSTQQTLYLDGVLINTSSVLRTIPIYSQIGAWNNAQWFKGKLDEVRIYNRSLSQEEIINDMQSGLIKHKIFRSKTDSGTYLNVNSLLRNGDAETGDLTNFGFDSVTTDTYEGNYAFYENGYKWLYSSDMIPIDVNSTYTLSGMFKSNGTGGQGRLYYGFVNLDKNGNSIGAPNVNAVPGTNTTLYEDIKSTDKIVKLTSCANWYVLYHGMIAFDIDDSENYADLPNRNLSNANIIRVENKGDYCEIEFSTTVGKTYPAGTKVRMHTSGGDVYTASAGALIPTTWTLKSGQIHGEALYGTNYGKFWPGAKYFKVSMGINYGQGSTYSMLIDNLKLEITNGTVTTSNYLDFAASDVSSPTSVSNLASTNVQEGGFYTTQKANFTWTGATDSGSQYYYYVNTEDAEGNYNDTISKNTQNITTGVAGYSVLCDDWQNSIPNDIIDTQNTNFSCTTMEGENYFFVKAIDGAGNSGPITRFGPFYVDTGTPEISFVSPTPANATETTQTNTTIKLEATDYQLKEFKFEWNNQNLSALDENLVLLYNFQNLSTLKENNSFVKDLSGKENNGIITGATYSDSGRYGKALSFDGNDYVSIPSSQSIKPTSAITVGAWAYKSSWNSPIGDKRLISSTESGGYTIAFDSTGAGLVQFYVYAGGYIIPSTNYTLLSPGWHYFTGTYDGVYARLYIDGELKNSTYKGVTTPISYDSDNSIQIGAEASGSTTPSGSYFNDLIDEVRIYNRSLSKEEINLLYQSNLQKVSQTKWELTMNLTNISKQGYWYKGYACDMVNNCNQTEYRLWSRINILPVVTSVVLNTTNGVLRATQNMSVKVQSHDLDAEDKVYNITDWRVNNNSIAVLNMPFEGASTSSWTKDYSKNANNGTVYGATWTTNGKVGGAYNFDGIDDYISVVAPQNITNKLTLSSWFKTSGEGNDEHGRISGVNGIWIMYLYNYSGSGRLRFWDGTIDSIFPGQTKDLFDNQWHLVNIVYDGDGIDGYIDGVKVGTIAKTGNFNSVGSTPFTIGGNVAQDRTFNGSIDEVLVFNRSLSAEQVKLIYDAGVAGHSIENISSKELIDREKWVVSVTPNDLTADGTTVDSNEINLFNNIPTVQLISPINNSDIINRTPEFTWIGSDLDGDTLSYQFALEEHKSAGTAICNDDITRNNLNIENYSLTQELKCLNDYGYYYTWKVRAYDGESYGPWSERTFKLNAYVVASLVNSEISFGTIDYLASKNTTTNDPEPFTLRNDGNVKINVSANATSMWNTVSTASEYYQTKVDKKLGFENAFNWAKSIVSWINMSLTGKVIMINDLDYHTNNDTAEVDILLQVPTNEGPGTKSSTIVFEAKLSEEEA